MLLTIWAYGSLRLKYDDKSFKTVKISGITLPLSNESIIFSEIDSASDISRAVQDTANIFKDIYLLNKSLPVTMERPVKEWFSNFQHRLLMKTASAADKGAQIIVWSEGNGITLKQQEGKFIQKCRALAKEKGIILFASLNTKTIGEIRSENKVMAINEKGEIQFTYYKSFPVPGAENSVKGDGKLPVIKTSYGKLTTVICFDADFPQLLRKSSKIKADLLIVPGYEWPAIDPYHTQMAGMRAIENGIPLFRQVNHGL